VKVSKCVGTKANSKALLGNELADDLKETFYSGKFSDVTVECRGETFACHALILKARSRVFESMLQVDMIEAKSNKVKVDDIDPKTMRELLHFLYTNAVNVEFEANDDELCYLLQAAHKYEVTPLADYCESLMEKKLSLQNVVDRLSFADLYDRPTLRHSCLAFITSTPTMLKQVQETDEFDRLCETRPKLLKDILAMSSGILGKRKRESPPGTLEFQNGSDWARLTLGNLKKACQERGIIDTGTKATLRTRLENHPTEPSPLA